MMKIKMIVIFCLKHATSIKIINMVLKKVVFGGGKENPEIIVTDLALNTIKVA